MVHEIDNHLESFEASAASEGMSANAISLLTICNAWQKIKPIMSFVRGLLFWKPKWQHAVDEFVIIADGICPGVK